MFNKYDAYKDSGVEWLGDIPEEWSIKPGLVAFSENKRSNKGMVRNTVLSLSYGKIIIKPEEKLVGLVPESFETYQLVEPSDIIIRCTDLQNDQTSLRTGLAKDAGIITSAYLNLNVKKGFDSKYLHYYLHALDTTKVLYKLGSGLRQNLSFLDFKRLPVLDIPLSQQQKISSFLDQKTSEIDQAIAIKEQQIALLNERKQIVIQKAVTQGLNPNVAMKDSGVEWIGQIPEHWDLLKLKNLALVNPTNTTLVNSLDKKASVCFLAMESVETNGTVDYSHTRELASVRSGFTSFVKGDVLVAKITPCFENGKGAYLDTLQTPIGFGSTEFHVLRVKKNCDPKFLYYVTKSHSFMDMGEGLMIGSAGQKRVPTSFMQNYLVAIPDMETQIEIVNFIDQRLGEIAEAIDLQKKQIEKLKEYKTTLINDAVTGKIKVA